MNLPGWFRRKKIIVLLFHGVVDADRVTDTLQIGPDNHISSTQFEKIINQVSQRFTPLSIDDAIETKRRRRPGIVITFDDGFRDNLYVVLPILKKYSVPVTIYITSGYIDRSLSPFEYRLAAIVQQTRELSLNTENGPVTVPTDSQDEKLETYLLLKNKLKFATNQIRQQTIQNLEQSLVTSALPIKYLTRKELCKLSASALVTIGSHTHYHQVLPSIHEKDVQRDIEKSKTKIEDWIGKPVHHFSYPYGEYNEKIITSLNDNGFKSAVTTKPGIEKNGFRDPMAICRFDIKSFSDFQSATVAVNK